MADTKYEEIRKVASKAVRNVIEQHKHELHISTLKVFVLENYGIGYKWLENYLTDLQETGYLSLEYDEYGKIRRVNKPKFDKSVYQ